VGIKEGGKGVAGSVSRRNKDNMNPADRDGEKKEDFLEHTNPPKGKVKRGMVRRAGIQAATLPQK